MVKPEKILTKSVSSENPYIRILDRMTEGCQLISPEWRYLYINEAAAAHFKQAREKLLGARVMDLYPGIEYTEVFRVMRRCMEHHEHHSMENEFTFPDGSKRWVSLKIQPDPDGIFITSIDITDRKQTKEALTQIFTMSMDMICIADINTATFTKVNPAFTEILGFSEAELLGKSFFRLYSS